MFDPLFDVVTAILAWFYDLVPSYGIAIGLLTLTAVVAVTPLTLRMTRNMLQMQHHMPELRKLQNEHKGDRQALNEATMAYYKEHGVNPVGCLLPMLVQGPIFLVMYRVVDGLTRRTTEIGTQLGFTTRRFADSASGGVPEYLETPLVRRELPFDPDFLNHDSKLYADLGSDVEMVSFGVDLARRANDVISENIVSALPYLLMLVIVLITSLYQQRQIQGRQGSAVANPQQQMMMKIIPFMLPLFSFVMPAAVVTYFIVQNLVRIAQQAYITRSFYRGEDSLGAQVVKQRAEAADGSGPSAEKPRSTRATTEGKGAPTPKRDAAKPQARAPSRRRDQAGRNASTRKPASGGGSRGRTGKAPSRSSSARRSPTNRSTGGRVTPPGSGNQNRSRNKKRRR
ncbi:MAG: YidC/Oxa1 family membrane protein insertase [Acidimicrobiaceae bacterium]|nr:YidC/Oxa1 family membrane protein insertase [Acidimicrobiaceae bacterium]